MAGARSFSYEGLFAKSARGVFAKSAAKPGKREVAPRRTHKYEFAGGLPDPDSLPLDALIESLKSALQETGRELVMYPHHQGYAPLRDFIAQKLAKHRNIHVSPDDIILGDGSGQPIHLIVEALIDPGDVVLTEDYTYYGLLWAMKRYRGYCRGVACDEEGMLPDALESAIKAAIAEGKKPKFIYAIPTFQNPQGWVMTPERRQAIVRFSQKYDVPVLEDDCYVDLRFEGEPVASIYSLDDTGRVIYVASFSKNIAPGMRVGYAAGPAEVINRLTGLKRGGGLSQFLALALYRYCTEHLAGHIQDVCRILRGKRDAMLAALDENFGAAAAWSRPAGGLFIWLRMPEDADLQSVEQTARDADVSYRTGPAFAPDGVCGKNYARLAFGYNRPEEIREGIARLAGVFKKEGLLKG